MAENRQITRLDEFTLRVVPDPANPGNVLYGQVAGAGPLNGAEPMPNHLPFGGPYRRVSTSADRADGTGSGQSIEGKFFEGPLMAAYGSAFSATARGATGHAAGARGGRPARFFQTTPACTHTPFGGGDEDVQEELAAGYAAGPVAHPDRHRQVSLPAVARKVTLAYSLPGCDPEDVEPGPEALYAAGAWGARPARYINMGRPKTSFIDLPAGSVELAAGYAPRPARLTHGCGHPSSVFDVGDADVQELEAGYVPAAWGARPARYNIGRSVRTARAEPVGPEAAPYAPIGW